MESCDSPVELNVEKARSQGPGCGPSPQCPRAGTGSSVTQGQEVRKDCERFSFNPGGLSGRGGQGSSILSCFQSSRRRQQPGPGLPGIGRSCWHSEPNPSPRRQVTAVVLSPHLSAQVKPSRWEASMEQSGTAPNRRGVCLPGNVSISYQPMLFHWGTWHRLRAPRVQVFTLLPRWVNWGQGYVTSTGQQAQPHVPSTDPLLPPRDP